jgi:hypothetical protein
VPPNARAVTLPLFPPKQLTDVLELIVAVTAVGSIMVTVVIAVQLFKSDIVTV